MIKKLLTGAVALAALQAAPAFATDAEFAVTGTVNSACSTFSGSEVKFNTIAIDAATGKVVAGQSATAATANVWCNKAGATISYTHDAMTAENVGSAPTGFTRTLDFTPVIKVGPTTYASNDAINVVADTLSVGANLLVPTDRPVADTYLGKITVTLTPGA
jgi:hypothetical protein